MATRLRRVLIAILGGPCVACAEDAPRTDRPLAQAQPDTLVAAQADMDLLIRTDTISVQDQASGTRTSDDINRVPAWYRGTKPWHEISREGRAEILAMRAALEANEATARKAGAATPSEADAAAAGRALINRIADRYKLSPEYRDPDTFGPRMVIWLPEAAWNRLSATERASIEAYMSSRYANWGIGVGRVRGSAVLLDRLVVER